ncbi:WD40-repeat-containing domain protein [Lactarius quietus]|nr:WD40-repeat-containing domain protein [Lactarius quietus]
MAPTDQPTHREEEETVKRSSETTILGNEIVWEDNSIRHFTHEGPVYAIAVHPTALTIVKLTGHSDSVTATAFSSDGEMRIGQDDYRAWEFLTELQGPDEVMWLRWHPKGPVLLPDPTIAHVMVQSNESSFCVTVPSGNTMQVFAGHTGPVQCGDFTPDGQDARFDLGGITSLAINPASTIAVVGGANGSVRVVSLSKGEVISALGGHAEEQSVEAIVFVNIVGAADGSSAPAGSAGAGTVVTGATDGKVCIWDLSTNRLRTTLEHKDAVTSLLVHPTKPHLVISSSADHTLRTWDARAGALVREHKGHQELINGAALGRNGEIVVSAGDDGACLVFDTE